LTDIVSRAVRMRLLDVRLKPDELMENE